MLLRPTAVNSGRATESRSPNALSVYPNRGYAIRALTRSSKCQGGRVRRCRLELKLALVVTVSSANRRRSEAVTVSRNAGWCISWPEWTGTKTRTFPSAASLGPQGGGDIRPDSSPSRRRVIGTKCCGG